MRVTVFATGFFLTTAVFSLTPMAALAHEAKVTCLCDCPDDHKTGDHKVKPKHAEAPRRTAHGPVRRAEGGHYSYAAFAPVAQQQWHGAWRVAPNDARIPAPVAYNGPPPGDDGLHIDERGWSGGVGNEGGGGGGGGGLGGTVILANGGSAQNGPTYNDYNQSFQQNPGAPGQFQNRLMGGLAPPPSSSK